MAGSFAKAQVVAAVAYRLVEVRIWLKFGYFDPNK